MAIFAHSLEKVKLADSGRIQLVRLVFEGSTGIQKGAKLGDESLLSLDLRAARIMGN